MCSLVGLSVQFVIAIYDYIIFQENNKLLSGHTKTPTAFCGGICGGFSSETSHFLNRLNSTKRL